MTRDEILTRYRRLREVSKQHHAAVLDVVAPHVVMDYAKRLGLTRGKVVVLDRTEDMTLAFDLAIYLAKPGRSHPLDRYAGAAQFLLGSDEATVLEAMRHARFSIWRVERLHETAGLVLRDLLRQEETWLVDESMEKNPPLGGALAGRLFTPESFAMTTGVLVPVTQSLMKEVFDKTPALQHATANAIAQDPRFATAIYRAGLARGATGSVRYEYT
jgi:hypothetical protein